MRTALLQLVVLVAPVLGAPPAAAQTSVVLRTSANVDDATPILLSEIADLAGPLAAGIAGTPVVSDLASINGGVAVVSLDDVRRALESSGVQLGGVSISGPGDGCAARFARPARRARPAALDAGCSAEPDEVDLSGPATVRTRIALRLIESFGAAPDGIRFGFKSSDAEVLATPIGDRRCDVQVTTVERSPRTEVRVFLYDSDRLVLDRALSVAVLLERSVVVATVDIPRRRTVTADSVAARSVWVSPVDETVAGAELVVGQQARDTIRAGETITRDRVVQPIAIRRGELVTVHCLAGGASAGAVQVRTTARASADGRLGELVELRLEGSKRTFTARVSGPGLAVLVLPDRGESSSPNSDRVRTVDLSIGTP